MADADGYRTRHQAPPPPPPRHQQRPNHHDRRAQLDDARGTLVLIGGGASPGGEALGTFITLADAQAGGAGRIVGLTSASGDPTGSARAWRHDFAAAGVSRIEIPVVERRDQACDEALARRVREAQGIFLGGGDQVKLVATLSGTPVGEAIYDAFCAGAVVCGTSAGAAALTMTTLANGEVDETTGQLVEMYIGPGLGLLGHHTMIDTHFAERRRLHRLFVAIAGYPELMGLGIDEDTALVVRGHLGTVVGKGGVTFVDGRDVHYDTAPGPGGGGPGQPPLTLSYLRVGIVGSGHVLNLAERELEVVVARRRGESPDLPPARGKAVERS
ncbi:MAG TPA: cyanophycinase [Gemmatimonadaceae bacterium]|nr:cyanophycinase [Gemmatimonadaceae bacterium]